MSASKHKAAASADGPLLIGIEAVAALLGRSTQSIWRDDKDGKIPRAIMLGSSRRWDFHEIKAWVHAKCPSRKTWEQSRAAKSETPPDPPAPKPRRRRKAQAPTEGVQS